MGQYIVLIYTPVPMAIVDDDENIVFFESHEAAMNFGQDHDACSALGFEVFGMLEI